MRAALVGIVAVTASLSAQAPAAVARGTIDGIVTDSTLRPVEGADVSIVRTGVHVATLASGRFRITSVPVGQYIVIVRRVGYHPISGIVEVPSTDTLRLSYTLERLAQALDTARVIEQRPSLRLAEFESRRRTGLGQFMTQAQIEKLNFTQPSDLLRAFSGLTVGTTVINRRMPMIRPCPMQFFIDGVLIPTPNVDDVLPSPKDIAGIEVHVSPGTIPLQYKTLRGGGFCGVILIWTRAG